MSLAGLLGRGFFDPAAGAIAAPALTVADNGDDTGALATITAATDGTTNTVRVARFTRTAATLAWSDAGSRSGNGTVPLSLTAGAEYLALVVSELNGVVQVSEVVGFAVTASGSFTFNDLRRHVLTNRSVNTEFFGELVTYRQPTRPDVGIKIHLDHKVEKEFDADSNEIVIEQLKVKVNRSDLSNAPDLQHAIRLAGESRDYLYAFSGKHDKVCYHATFERRYRRSQGI